MSEYQKALKRTVVYSDSKYMLSVGELPQAPYFIISAKICVGQHRWTNVELGPEDVARVGFRLLKIAKEHVAEDRLNVIFDEEIGAVFDEAENVGG